MFRRALFKWNRLIQNSPAKNWLTIFNNQYASLNSKIQTMWYNSSVKAREIMEDISGKPSEPSGTYYHENNQNTESSSVPFMITKLMKVQLLELGYTPDQISDMTPITAAEIIKKQIKYEPGQQLNNNENNNNDNNKQEEQTPENKSDDVIILPKDVSKQAETNNNNNSKLSSSNNNNLEIQNKTEEKKISAIAIVAQEEKKESEEESKSEDRVQK